MAAAKSSIDTARVAGFELGCCWYVLLEQPEAQMGIRVECEHDLAAADAAHLREARVQVGPMMNGHTRHGGIETGVGKRQRLGTGQYGGQGADRALRNHERRDVDGDDGAVGWLVRASSRAHVDDGSR